MAMKTVWILGAGFSRSLGGPLLDDLLSPPTIQFVQSLYADNSHFNGSTATAHRVRSLFENFGPTATAPSRRLWPDAEAFLDQLDAAARGPNSPAAKRMEMAATMSAGGISNWPELSTAARRLVAASCLAFLKDADLDEERWQPYRSWAGALVPSDTIVTFNYDRVLETLGSFDVKVNRPSRSGGEKPLALKLHGSVDWYRKTDDDGSVTYSAASEEFALTCPGDQIGIATPGPTKRLATGELAVQWTRAMNEITEAAIIVFIGYRFPPSDAEAREKLLGAIRENKSRHLQLHIVLGPELKHRDVIRLEQLLRYAMKRRGRWDLYDEDSRVVEVGTDPGTFTLSTHALFAEDLLTVWDRDLLWPPKFEMGTFIR
jgi:hypothetical protein